VGRNEDILGLAEKRELSLNFREFHDQKNFNDFIGLHMIEKGKKH
jgi:hypothetical protein